LPRLPLAGAAAVPRRSAIPPCREVEPFAICPNGAAPAAR